MRIALLFSLVLMGSGCGEREAGVRPVAESEAAPAAAAATAGRAAPLLPDAPVTGADWDAAAAAIRRLPLAAFPDLPAAVRTELSAHGCEIPQAFHRRDPHNLIQGHFAAPDQVDWAALCATGDAAEIVVVWGGPRQCASRLERTDHRSWLQTTGEREIGYSRAIGYATIESIVEHAENHGTPLPPALDHGGIDHAFVEKASTVLFCHEGAWLRLQGAD